MSNLLNESSGIVVLTSGDGVDVKGAYVQLFASTTRLSRWLGMFVVPIAVGTSGSRDLIDIATGAAASEVDQICNMGQGNMNFSIDNIGGYWLTYSIPWEFASGLRLSARIADDRPPLETHTYHIEVRLFEQPIP